MDDLINNYSNQMYQGRPNRGSLSFPKNCIFITIYIAKCRNIVKWYCGQ